jgi:hypothetical protein
MLIGCFARPLSAQSHPVTSDSLSDEHVQRAIKAIVEELYDRKDPEHFWDPVRWNSTTHGQKAQKGGYTALAVFALLSAGESYQDERMIDAITWLETAGLSGTYAISLRAHVWALLPPKFEDRLAADTKWLIDAFDEEESGWGYEHGTAKRQADNSLAQYGVLGLWEAAKRGARIEPRYWRNIEQRFLNSQFDDGAWNYMRTQPATGSMSAAGLTVLFITQDLLHAADAVDLKSRGADPHESAIELGLRWFENHFSATENPGKDTHFFYYLYGVERVGLASGYRNFGTHDWFREGAAEIIRRLCRVDPDSGEMAVHAKIGGQSRGATIAIDDLSFALLFLSRGRVPVAVNKLRDEAQSWNNRPRDVANLVAWIGDKSETALNWQIVDLGGEPEQWLDAPLLYWASSDCPSWLKSIVRPGEGNRADRRPAGERASDDAIADEPEPAALAPPQLQKLKRYLDLGGMLLAVNEGSSRAFAQAIEQAGTMMYPQYAWRALPEDHDAYRLMLPPPGRRPPLRALSNGVRELIIISSDDLASSFQARKADRSGHFETAANIYMNASEMNRPRPRLGQHAAASSPDGDAISLQVVRATHQGNWNAEPLAGELLRASALGAGLDLQISEAPLATIHELDPPPALVWVSGTDAIEFDEEQKKSIRACVEEGGVILFETAGGRGEFASAAEATLQELLGVQAQPMLRDPIITGEGVEPLQPLNHMEYRAYSRQELGARESSPRLRGMTIDGKARIIFSREDLSHALLDQPLWGVNGYAPSSARGLMKNMIRFGASLRDPG